MMRSNHRPRWLYLAMIPLLVTMGLATRQYPSFFPALISEYGGDTLWAMLVFVLFASLFIQRTTGVILLLAAAFALSIELSQLYHAAWIDTIRANKWAALVLGHRFVWQDLVCYSVGIGLAAAADAILLTVIRHPKQG